MEEIGRWELLLPLSTRVKHFLLFSFFLRPDYCIRQVYTSFRFNLFDVLLEMKKKNYLFLEKNCYYQVVEIVVKNDFTREITLSCIIHIIHSKGKSGKSKILSILKFLLSRKLNLEL